MIEAEEMLKWMGENLTSCVVDRVKESITLTWRVVPLDTHLPCMTCSFTAFGKLDCPYEDFLKETIRAAMRS